MTLWGFSSSICRGISKSWVLSAGACGELGLKGLFILQIEEMVYLFCEKSLKSNLVWVL